MVSNVQFVYLNAELAMVGALSRALCGGLQSLQSLQVWCTWATSAREGLVFAKCYGIASVVFLHGMVLHMCVSTHTHILVFETASVHFQLTCVESSNDPRVDPCMSPAC